MKILLTALVMLFTFSISYSQVNFEHISYNEALAKAKKENKIIFIDCWASWCGPCKALIKKTFPLKEVGDYMNSRYINLKVDIEKGDGPHIQSTYKIGSLPTLLFVDSNGKEITRAQAGYTAEQFINSIKKAFLPENTTDGRRNRYKTDKSYFHEYVRYLSRNHLVDELTQVLEDKFKEQTDKDRFAQENWKLYRRVEKINSPIFKYIEENYDRIQNMVEDPKQIDNMISNVIGISSYILMKRAILKKCEKKDIDTYNYINKLTKKFSFAKTPTNMLYWKIFKKADKKEFDSLLTYFKNNWKNFNNRARHILFIDLYKLMNYDYLKKYKDEYIDFIKECMKYETNEREIAFFKKAIRVHSN